jgi:hypothetical protein
MGIDSVRHLRNAEDLELGALRSGIGGALTRAFVIHPHYQPDETAASIDRCRGVAGVFDDPSPQDPFGSLPLGLSQYAFTRSMPPTT